MKSCSYKNPDTDSNNASDFLRFVKWCSFGS